MEDALTKPPPGKPPGERLASYFENFFRTVVGISTLGASITFSKIVQAPVTPFHDFGFSQHDIQYLITVSWLFFILALAFTSFFASALSLWRPRAIESFGTQDGAERRKVLWFATGVSALLFGLIVAAFVTLALVVVGYSGPVGWIALAFIIVFAVLGFGVIVWRSPMHWPNFVMRWEKREEDAFEKHMHRRRVQTPTTDDDGLRVQKNPAQRQQPQPEPQPAPEDAGYGYGRSTSGDYGQVGLRYGRRQDGYVIDRYSRASTVTPDRYDSGRFQRSDMIYDDGIREGLVMNRYV